MARILTIGVLTEDIVNTVKAYPDEDSKVRTTDHHRRVGGNAANTAMKLAWLKNESFWLGNLPDHATWVRRKLDHWGVDYTLAQELKQGHLPTSFITLSEETGSRTIVHHRDMPEYDAEHFFTLDIRPFDWLHFEARELVEIPQMMSKARGMCGIPVSLEIEKPHGGVEAMFEFADVIFFSKEYAQSRGFSNANDFLKTVEFHGIATCAWGALGAWAKNDFGQMFYAPAKENVHVVDSVGAGDVFNAGMVDGICRGMDVEAALKHAVQLAGDSVEHEGVVW